MPGSENLSSVLGWISIACWIVVYSPQLYENYTLQSGEGLSVLFVVIWILGDLSNLAGAILAGLLPTVIILGLYYTSCDLILLFQIYYYRSKKRRLEAHAARESVLEEHAPLLGHQDNRPEAIESAKSIAIRYLSALSFVVVVGVAAWWVTKEDEHKKHLVDPTEDGSRWWLIQSLGWSSASLFLGARIPQILKNFKTRCEGLSPALFFFSIFGNTTYALSILAKSVDKEYLIKNGGWLAGMQCTLPGTFPETDGI
ncbi:hypothetical protein HYPSUDRAFT_290406 [Hypholoma sublateritium FD-334 SS-4]|uniref:PQ-loop-domain-containing protein n=1 Tax=Hypholoma sublateritium (strain FD-334 SS-4) TaxID=945553 RepID=A0A0D2NBF4_HYPSF|nr:hypothetical protein HYPSUDRAFT_290406 [Hypholoma sublateritium FD-334 SS-4]